MTTLIITAPVQERPIVLAMERPRATRLRISPLNRLLTFLQEHFLAYCLLSMTLLPLLMTVVVTLVAIAVVGPIALLLGLL